MQPATSSGTSTTQSPTGPSRTDLLKRNGEKAREAERQAAEREGCREGQKWCGDTYTYEYCTCTIAWTCTNPDVNSNTWTYSHTDCACGKGCPAPPRQSLVHLHENHAAHYPFSVVVDLLHLYLHPLLSPPPFSHSVGWYKDLAADHVTAASSAPVPRTIEEEDDYAGDVPAIRVSEPLQKGAPISCKISI